MKALIDPAPHNDRELLERLAGGDATAFTLLFHSYKDKLYSFILHLSGSTTIAEDVLQEIFLKIWQNREGLTKVNNFNAYLFRMAQNKALNVLRRHSLEALLVKKLGDRTSVANPGEPDSAKEVQELLNKVLERLPAQQRKVFELSRNEDLKYEEIAERLNISVSTVRNHMVQALKTIREFIRESGLVCIIYYGLAAFL